MASKTIFDYMNAIYNKSNIEFSKKECSSYLLTLWFSHDKSLLDITEEANKYLFMLPDELIYKYYWHKIPKGKRFIRWVKKEESLDKKEKEKMNTLKKDFMLSKNELDKYKPFIKDVEVKKVTKKKNDKTSVFFS